MNLDNSLLLKFNFYPYIPNTYRKSLIESTDSIKVDLLRIPWNPAKFIKLLLSLKLTGKTQSEQNFVSTSLMGLNKEEVGGNMPWWLCR